MKKVLAVVAVVGLMAAATSVSALSIKNTKHDLSTTGGTAFKSTNTTQICVFCHTPHNAVGVNGSFYPLWNRNNPAAGGFDLYSSGSLNNSYITGGQGGASTGFTADSVSLYCMSCHDGVTTLGAVKNPPLDAATITFGAGMDKISGDANLNDASNSLMNDHPVNFGVVNGKDAEIGAVASSKINTGRLTNALPLYKSARDTANSLECASCHAVHNNVEGMFLRTTMNGSLLCLGCHIK